METSSRNHHRRTSILVVIWCLIAGTLFINSIPPCDIYDFGLHFKGCVYKLETIETSFELQYTTDGKLLMSSGAFDTPIQLWSASDAKPIHTFAGPDENPQQQGTISQDGKIIAISSDASRNTTIFDTQSLQPIQIIEHYMAWRLRFSPRDPLLVYSNEDGQLHLLEITGNKDITIENTTYSIDFSISPDGQILASRTVDEDVHLFSLPSGHLSRVLNLENSILAFAFTSDSKSLVSLSLAKDGSIVTFWDVANGSPERALQLPLNVDILAVSPDNTTIAVGQHNCVRGDRCVTIWDITTGKMMKKLPIRSRIFALTFSPDGNHLAIAAEEVIYIWENPKQ